VWRGAHRETGHPVAVKLISKPLSDTVPGQEVLGEIQAVARIAYLHVQKIFAGGTYEGRTYIVSELLEGGETLADRIARGRMSTTQMAGIAHQIANALITAQRSGVSHNDLKPQNIVLVKDVERSSGERAIVCDFGLGRLACAYPELGPGAYTSPEVWQRHAGDGLSDIYALGCLAFEMASGRPPFTGPREGLRAKHLTADPPTVRSFAPDFTIALDTLLARMLSKVPSERPKSLRDVAGLFDRFAGHSAPLDETQQ
jgi:serine/threonine protein kinase